jgi:RNA polymerase sigma-70 factor (ECF subfamily)
VVARIAQGSEVALARAYQRHGGRVFALARRILGDDQQAGDVAEAVFLALWDHPEEFDARRGSLASQLLMDARRRSLELVRAGGAGPGRERVDGGAPAGAANRTAGRRPRPDDRRSRDPLAGDERRVLEMAFFEGCTSGEIAQLLDVDEATVRGRIQSGLRRLRSADPEIGAW